MHTAICNFLPHHVQISKCTGLYLKNGLSWGHFVIPRADQYPDAKDSHFNRLFSIKNICGSRSQASQFPEAKDLHFTRPFSIKTICRARSQDCIETLTGRVNDDAVGETSKVKEATTSKQRSYSIAYIRWMLSNFDDGRISISPYDTAWVALLENIDGSGSPQFPSSLEWIAQNQLPDGSWGDAHIFSAYDRLVNTLACVIALRSWNIHPEKSEKGIRFFKETISKLGTTDVDSMTCGFEVVFPPLIERARNLGIEIPYDAPFLKDIFHLRSLKFQKIPRDLMHEVPTPILYNLEGIEDLDWEKLLKLQTEEGSFLTSPAATAFAFMHTKDRNCLNYLTNTVTKFNGGAPTVYPIDVFARLWAVDRLQRLGISRFFEQEIKECIDYVYRYWTEKGVFSGRNARVCDMDDTAMGFRLLRVLGCNVSPGVFQHFKKDNKFVCLGGELNGSPTTILNLYKASQVQFPGEKILEEAKSFSFNFLKERVENDKFVDKWVISKDIPGEIKYGFEIPWYASLPRVEARLYVEHYSGFGDAWVGKTLYRVAEISNNVYLELAKSDYNECQAQHQLEWISMQEFSAECNFKEFGISERNLLHAYFLAAATIFEPERSIERLAWAKSWVIVQALTNYFDEVAKSWEQRSQFVAAFKGSSASFLDKIDKMGQGLVLNIQKFIHRLSVETFKVLHRDIRQQLYDVWGAWLTTLLNMTSGDYPSEATLLVHTINLSTGSVGFSDEMLYNDEYNRLSNLTNKVCHQLRQCQKSKKIHMDGLEANDGSINSKEIETGMQELMQLVLQSSTDTIPQTFKQTFLTLAKAFYYAAYCSKGTMSIHISKVLFQRVV